MLLCDSQLFGGSRPGRGAGPVEINHGFVQPECRIRCRSALPCLPPSGLAGLIASYLAVVHSRAWSDATRWLANYGAVGLLIIAATPLPLTPALMIASISRLPVMEVLLALWPGKLVKYMAYAWLVSAFPSRVPQHGHIRVSTLHAALARAAAPGSGKPKSTHSAIK